MLTSIRQLYYNCIWKKIHLIKLKSIISNKIIESWRIQKYEIIINKNNIISNYSMINNNSIIDNINNINILLNLIKYDYLLNKYSINIDLFVNLINNITIILHFYHIQFDELFEYIICK
jgi:hypothetical protein